MKNWEIRKLGSDRSYLIFKSTDSGYDTIAKIEAVEPENMKLFLAAPEMLALLGNILSHFKGRKDADFSDCYGYLKQDMEDMIKKATGK